MSIKYESDCFLRRCFLAQSRVLADLKHISNLEQVANLLCTQANSTSYPQWDRKWVVSTATGWRPSVADWAIVCLLAAPWVQLSVSASNGWPHNALQHHWLMPISCHFRDCKALLVTSLTRVSGAIASVQTFTFIFTFRENDSSGIIDSCLGYVERNFYCYLCVILYSAIQLFLLQVCH